MRSDTSDRWRRMETLFERALERAPEEREAFLASECCDDEELLAAVLSLLDSDERSGGFLEGPLADTAIEAARPGGSGEARSRREGAWVGPYRLLSKLGEGGMSTVYLAEQREPFRREVALKVIRRGMESAETLRRVRVERQILAGLEHPNIARLYDGGMTEDGLPYFALEKVEGRPIDAYCESRGLSVSGRLRLFGKVCAAVSFAHRSLVVHRDLKPGNILVGEDGEPKLLDFGIAKILTPAVGNPAAEPTAAWMRLLTPHYASPEQILGEAVTTASDVYSLGVLLYKLLTGRVPHQLEGASVQELERRALADEPTRPSAAAADGSAEGLRRSRRLRGDLDTIVLKAMHRDPRRRYRSADHLAEDVERHLGGFPVEARPDSLGYRAGKFLRRNWLAAGTAALFTLVLAGSTATVAAQAARVRLERDQLREVVSFVVDVFNVAGEGEQLTVRQAVDRSAALLERKLERQPEVQATLRDTLGRIYLNLGVTPQAEAQLRDAVALRGERFGPASLEMAESLSFLGVALTLNGQLDQGEAEARRALEVFSSQVGPADPTLLRPLNNLVRVLCYRGDRDEAASELASDALDLARKLPPEDAFEQANAMTHQALLLGRRGEHEAALDLYGEALERYREEIGMEHPQIAVVLSNLASNSRQRGDLPQAEARYREALALQRKLLGEDSGTVAQTLHNLGSVLLDAGKLPEAEGSFREAVSIVTEVYGPEHFSALFISAGLAQTLIRRGNAPEAEALLRQGLPLWREHLEGSWLVAHAESVLGESLGRQGRFEEAESLLEESYRSLLESPGEDHPRTRAAHRRLVELHEAWGRPDRRARRGSG